MGKIIIIFPIFLEIKGEKYMLEKTTPIKVTNRDCGTVSYKVPELHVTRLFQKGEVKEIPFNELQQLAYTIGGKVLLKDCLIVENEEALGLLVGGVEPEYFYTEKDVKTLLTSGTLEQLEDCLDFAPSGVIDLVKELAVKLEISDINKRNAILKATGFNVTKAIEINHASQETDELQEEKTRRTTPIVKEESSPAAPARRTAAPKYNVVKKVD
jgi:hypothetical protein